MGGRTKKVYDPVKLKKEVDDINSPISLEEFCELFIRRKERVHNHLQADNV